MVGINFHRLEKEIGFDSEERVSLYSVSLFSNHLSLSSSILALVCSEFGNHKI